MTQNISEPDSGDVETCDVCGDVAEYADWVGDGRSLYWCAEHVPVQED